MDTSKINNYSISPVLNGLSDHDAQLLMIKEINLQIQGCNIFSVRNINKFSTIDFISKLSCETWEDVFCEGHNKDVDMMFNSFLNTYLKIFYSCFPKIIVKEKNKNNSWITTGITNLLSP
jgi:hypothetical protein